MVSVFVLVLIVLLVIVILLECVRIYSCLRIVHNNSSESSSNSHLEQVITDNGTSTVAQPLKFESTREQQVSPERPCQIAVPMVKQQVSPERPCQIAVPMVKQQVSPERPCQIAVPMVKQVLFFPDSADSCRAGARCRSKSCKYLHESNLLKIKEWLSKTKRSLKICVYIFTFKELVKVLKTKLESKVAVQIISSHSYNQEFDAKKLCELRKAGAEIRLLGKKEQSCSTDSGGLMHHKFAIRDDEELLNGSFNWTHSACRYNYENLMIIREKLTVLKFMTEFDRLWGKAEKFTL